MAGVFAMRGEKVVLVTGASGFVGRHCLDLFIRRGYEVHAVSRRELGKSGVIRHAVDLLDDSSQIRLIGTVKPDIILHSAWYAEHGKYWHAPENQSWLEASANLFERAVRAGAKRIVGVGSCAEYDWERTDCIPWKETDACNPGTLYGQSKLALKNILEETGISYAWARLFFLYGPHETPERLVPSVIRALLNNQAAYCTSGKQIRDFTDVRDAGAILALLADSEVQGVVNVASGNPVSIAYLAQSLGEIMGKPDLIKLGGLADREGDAPFIVADTARLSNEIPYVQRSIEQGLKDAINWWRDDCLSGSSR